MAKIFLLPMHFNPEVRRQFQELETAFIAENLAFFLLALDTSTKLGGTSPQGVKVMQRAYELLREAKNKFADECG